MRFSFSFTLMLLTGMLMTLSLQAQQDYPWLRTGDELFLRGGFADAETAYRKAREEKEKPATSYNLGNSIYYQNRLPEAIREYEKTIETTDDIQLKSHAYYNLGNAHFQSQAYDKSIQAYRQALKLMPDDLDAKKNLMLAMQQQQQQQQQQHQQKQDPKQDQDQQRDPEEQNTGDQQEPSPQPQTSPESRDQMTPEELSQEEAREILKAIEREDQRVQEKLKKTQARKSPPVKDW